MADAERLRDMGYEVYLVRRGRLFAPSEYEKTTTEQVSEMMNGQAFRAGYAVGIRISRIRRYIQGLMKGRLEKGLDYDG
jgi:hypothetical protein